MVRRERFVNDASTTLNEALDNSETVITVTDGSVFPSEGDFRVIVDDEVMLCTSRSSNDLTVVRGVDDTSAVTHDNGSTIKALLTANNLIDHFDQAFGVGVLGSGGGSSRLPYRLLDKNNNTLDSSDFTWVNQGSSSVADDPFGGMTVTLVETNNDWRLLTLSAPTPPYTLTVNLKHGPGATFSTSGTVQGAGFRESSTGEFVIGVAETGDHCDFWRFDSPTVFNSAATTNNRIPYEIDEIWMELEDDNTDLKYRVSFDGITYFEVGVDGRTAHMAGGPDQICWAVNSRGSANKLYHLRAFIVT